MESHESSIAAFLPRVAERARFEAANMQKLDVCETGRLLLGLNCFEPGQTQRVHAHADADKFYLVLAGRAKVVVGDDARDVSAGDLVFAAAGIPHGVETAYERTVLLVGITK